MRRGARRPGGAGLAAALVVALAGSVALGGCRDSAGPTGIAGTYELATIDGRPLPVVLRDDAAQRVDVLGGSITLDAEGAATIRFSHLVTDREAGEEQHVNLALSGSYHLVGQNIQIGYARPDGTLVLETGTVSGGVLLLQTDGGTFEYRRR
jgi:hypothetical protein